MQGKRAQSQPDGLTACRAPLLGGAEDEGWSHAERQRRQRRAGRFGEPAAKRGGGGAAWQADERRQRLLAMMEEAEDEEIDWDAVAIKVGGWVMKHHLRWKMQRQRRLAGMRWPST